ncbi:RNA polymerase sigma factor [Spirosoma radiotolerans]|uniref:ECF subfamily RNA polymerase sigma-24 subunit n=1 Tax=Spirosoma radiotolerans TaxID=1379870 RepID=A0A0E3ZVS7_9BACT|nr:sigma-70 family RNA polymerase sigma factor [Spirosoma radiotolerans]AKD56273.1 ECF subfamily RNA polymerase sigma-24 subunit [Spirosoma radiotolerans]
MADPPKRNIIETVKQYGSRLSRFIRGQVKSDEDAEDILQDVWYQLTKVVDLDGIESMSGWLFQVAKNRITDAYRKKKEDSLSELMSEDDDDFRFRDILLADAETPEDQFFKDIFWEELMKALDELPENQRMVFVQNELEDLTLQEIADQTGDNLKTIISRKRYAIQHLRKRLQRLYDELDNL